MVLLAKPQGSGGAVDARSFSGSLGEGVERARSTLFRLVGAVLLASLAPSCPSTNLHVQDYVLVKNVQLSDTLSEYTYRASVSNAGPHARGVTAALTVTAPGITV